MRRASQKRLYAELVRKTSSSDSAPPRRECICTREREALRPGAAARQALQIAIAVAVNVVSSIG
eukprot:scaffold54883_cov31-Tisochrysis_lutea.AAC.5